MTDTQAQGLENKDLVERVEDAFDHPLIMELASRFREFLENTRPAFHPN